MNASSLQLFCLVVFVLAIAHTFSTGIFERLAHSQPKHAGLWHFFGEVEAVFGLWALVLVLGLVYFQGLLMVYFLSNLNFFISSILFLLSIIVHCETWRHYLIMHLLLTSNNQLRCLPCSLLVIPTTRYD